MLPRKLDYLPAPLCIPEAAQGHTATAPHCKAGQDHHPSSEHPTVSLGLGKKKDGLVGEIRPKHLSCRKLLYFFALHFLPLLEMREVGALTCLGGSSPLVPPSPCPSARVSHSQRGSQDSGAEAPCTKVEQPHPSPTHELQADL